jgi:hypothetical protein
MGTKETAVPKELKRFLDSGLTIRKHAEITSSNQFFQPTDQLGGQGIPPEGVPVSHVTAP